MEKENGKIGLERKKEERKRIEKGYENREKTRK